jgi:hypothetical protein
MQLFLSHAWDDKPLVLPIKAALEAAGFTVWLDAEQMPGGDALFAKISEGIDAAEVVLLFISPSYLRRENCNRVRTLPPYYFPPPLAAALAQHPSARDSAHAVLKKLGYTDAGAKKVGWW